DRVPDDAAAYPEVDLPVHDREGADREREVEVAVRVDAAERTHRRAATDRLERRDELERAALRTAGDGAARKHGFEQLAQANLGPQLALDRRDEMCDAGELALDEQLRPVDAPGDADAREVVPLEVDDHHVLGRVLRRLDRDAGGTRPLDRHR